MPAYFYHLAFELYPHPKPDVRGQQPVNQAVYIPPPGTDVFKSNLPVHSVTPWGLENTKISARSRTKTDSSINERPHYRTVSFHRSSTESRSELDLASPSEGLVIQTSKPVYYQAPAEDWRFEGISIESIDMASGGHIGNRPRGKSLTHANTKSSSGGGLDTRAQFVPADARNTDIGWGVVHLYREAGETLHLYDETHVSSYTSRPSHEAFRSFNEDECTTLCILAVPSYMMPSDLLGWAGEQGRENVSHFRLIRTGKTNRYMVLMKFRDAKNAKSWRRDYNGKHFNSMEPEFAHIVFVQSITFQTDNTSQQPSSFPDMSDDPFSPETQSVAKTPAGTTVESSSIAFTPKPFAPPTPNLVELPTCPVCLERMDETTGLLTILCQHVFHCDCLEKWRGSGCPVCRYTQNNSIPGMRHSSSSPNETESMCSICGAESNLWICLICGNVGCGRYDSAHAFAHYEATAHCYAMDITTQHVWDYAGDGYVHRLIQNKSDGQLVDLPAAWASGGKSVSGGMAAMGADMVPREKMEAMGNEYTYLLQSQLENQRSYFEKQLERAVDKASEAHAAAEKATAALDSVVHTFSQLQSQYAESQVSIQGLERDLERATRKAEKTDALARKLTKDWLEEKSMNDGLMDKVRVLDVNMKLADEKLLQLATEKQELEELNRDLTFSITGSQKLQELRQAGEDVDGTIEVPVAAQGQKMKKGKGKR